VGIVQTRGTEVQARFGYALDAVGNRSAVTETLLTPAAQALGGEALLGAAGRAVAANGAQGVAQRGAAGRSPGLSALTPGALARVGQLPALSAGTSLTVTWTAAGDSGSGVAACAIQYRVNEGPWVSWQDCVQGGTATFSTTGESDTYAFRSLVRDVAGNQITSTVPMTLYDTIAPQTAITAPVSGRTYAVAPGFGGTASDGGGSGLAGVRVSLQGPDGRRWSGSEWVSGAAWITATGTAGWSCATCGAALGPLGQYTLSAQAVDGAGNSNRATPAVVTFTYDTRPVPITTTIRYSYDGLAL
jgi:hypothetical protein